MRHFDRASRVDLRPRSWPSSRATPAGPGHSYVAQAMTSLERPGEQKRKPGLTTAGAPEAVAPADKDARLVDAYTGHAGAVTAFLRDSGAPLPSHQMAEFVPNRVSPSACVREIQFPGRSATSARRENLCGWTPTTFRARHLRHFRG
jgi:hypothetical protein